MDRRWRIDPAAGNELPNRLTCLGVEGDDGVSVRQGNVHSAARRDGRRQTAGEFGLPLQSDLRLDGRRRRTVPARIVPECRPVVGIWDFGFAILDSRFQICRSFPRGAALEALVVRQRLFAGSRLRGDGGKAQQFRTRLAEALVGRDVQQPVAGHHAQLAGSPQPVILAVVVADQVHELGAFHAADQIPLRRLVAITPMMVLRAAQVGHDDPLFLFARPQIEPDGHRVGALAHRFSVLVHAHHPAPDDAAGHEQIFALAAGGRRNLLPPEQIARGSVASFQRVLGVQQHHAAVSDQRAGPARHVVHGPQRLAVLQAQGRKRRTGLEDHSAAVDRQLQRADGLGLLGPAHGAGLAVDGHQAGRLAFALAAALGGAYLGIAAVNHDDAVAGQNLLRRRCALDRRQNLAVGRIQDGQRSLKPERRVQPLAVGHQPPLILVGHHGAAAANFRPRHALEFVASPFGPAPGLDRPLPQQAAVERIAADQRPAFGQTLVSDADHSLVQEIEDAVGR